jgi:hypothetical protein
MSENIINALVYEVCKLSSSSNLGNYFFITENGQYTTLEALIQYFNKNVSMYTNANVTIFLNVATTAITFENLDPILQSTMYISLEISPITTVTGMVI